MNYICSISFTESEKGLYDYFCKNGKSTLVKKLIQNEMCNPVKALQATEIANLIIERLSVLVPLIGQPPLESEPLSSSLKRSIEDIMNM